MSILPNLVLSTQGEERSLIPMKRGTDSAFLIPSMLRSFEIKSLKEALLMSFS